MGGFLLHLTPEKNGTVLNTTCGPLRGNIYRHGDKIVDGYLGIPFAKAPIGPLRFKKPEAAEKWTEPRDCYKYGPAAPQTGKFASIPAGNVEETAEDNCLTVNVFAPRWKTPEFPSGLPVMVYIYGGGFEVGTSRNHDYSTSGVLPMKDIVLVFVNYRVGPLGFLTTGDDVAKGNYGLWDQTLGLHWVQQHIDSFGGDPKNVTIFGTSAGGASVDLLALSPHSNKLFNRYIACSGAAYCDFATRSNAEQAKISNDFARHHGYKGKDSKSLLEWYDSQPLSVFKDMEGFVMNASGFLTFSPNIDGDFLPKPLDELRNEAPQLDMMATVGEYEGLGMAFLFAGASDPVNLFGLTIAEAYGPGFTDDCVSVQKNLLEFYTDKIDNTDKAAMTKAQIEFLGDAHFNIGVLETAKSCVKHGNTVYLASVDYCNREVPNPWAAMLPFHAATHGEEFKYVFGEQMFADFNPTETDFQVINLISGYFTNFAKYGNPNGKLGGDIAIWEKYTLELPYRYFKIDHPMSGMKEDFQNGRLKIHEEVYRNSKKHQENIYGKCKTEL